MGCRVIQAGEQRVASSGKQRKAEAAELINSGMQIGAAVRAIGSDW